MDSDKGFPSGAPRGLTIGRWRPGWNGMRMTGWKQPGLGAVRRQNN
jgi:hypothetical protein